MERLTASRSTIKSPVNLSDVLSPDRVCMLQAQDKNGVLDELAALLATSENIGNADELRKAIHAREALMSTGIGLGIGVPHVRIDSVRSITMAAALATSDIRGYESLDGAPVRLVFMIAASPDQHAEYIRLLALVSRLVKDPSLRERLFSAASAAELYELLTGTCPA
jgi:PTS system nitrogen regulatory IIA component